MSTLPMCFLASHLRSHSWQDFRQQKVNPLFRSQVGWALPSPLHPTSEHCGEVHASGADSPSAQGALLRSGRHQPPSPKRRSETQGTAPPTRRAACGPTRSPQRAALLDTCTAQVWGRKMLTMCSLYFYCIFFSSSRTPSLSYKVPLHSPWGAQTSARQSLGGGCSTETRTG